MPELFSDRTWLWISAAFYAGAFIWATIAMIRSRARTRGVMLGLIGAGLVIQTFGLHMRGMEAGGCPVRNTFEVVQFVIWSLTVLYLIVGPAFSLSLLGYFTSGLAATMSVTSLLMARWDATVGPPKFGGVPWVEAHASLALFAYGAFGTLALTSLMFLLQTYSLKRKHLRGMFGFLPSIVALETINFRLLLTGISVLSISIGLGAAYYTKEPDSIGGSKLLIALAVWCAYCAVFFLRARRLLVSVGLAWSCLALFGVALYSIPLINSGVVREPAPAGGPAMLDQPEKIAEAA
jgi:ABC-type uncharacterized transport system permease subunit